MDSYCEYYQMRKVVAGLDEAVAFIAELQAAKDNKTTLTFEPDPACGAIQTILEGELVSPIMPGDLYQVDYMNDALHTLETLPDGTCIVSVNVDICPPGAGIH